MSDVQHLVKKLKTLKLGGMLETLDMRLKQCQDGHLGYIEFLELLLEDELQRRSNKKLQLRVSQAHFEEVKTLEMFNFEFNPKIPSRQIMDLANCHFIERKEWAIFVGPVGVGKTHLIQAIGHQACRVGYRVVFIRASRLFTDLAGGHADGTWEKRLRHYLKPDLLLIDDFAMKELTLKQAEDFYELVNERSSRSGSLVLASNRSPKDWYPLFPNPVLAEGVLDRLINKAHHVMLTGKSYRTRLKPDSIKEALPKEVKEV
jgi:DNA replication protein DnaC